MIWLFTIGSICAPLFCLIYIGNKYSKADWGGWTVNWIDGLIRLLCRIVHRLPANYIPLPETGGALVVANHVSGLDPFLLIAASRRPLRFLIAREEYEKPLLRHLLKLSGCIPIDRLSKTELALRQALRALQAGEVIAIFPHGRIHLDHDPPRKLKGGVARLASWSGVPILPVRIDGVGGEGKVALATWVPSHVKLTMAEPFVCDKDGLTDCLEKIAGIIDNKP